jgi:hypothetical protein
MRGSSSVYFNNFASSGEQDLLHDLIIESISIYGQDVMYLPRKITNFDQLYTEDDSSEYTQALQVVMYIESVDGFTGDGNFMSKFGLQIRDQVTFVVSQRIFGENIGVVTNQQRPNEGDLIYFPLNNKCFKVMYVDKFSMFYPLGTLPTWKFTCELFEYSNEVFNTGFAEIDKLQKNYSTNIFDHALLDENDDYLTDENGDILVMENYNLSTTNPAADNDAIQYGTDNFGIGSDDFISFEEKNPFAEDDY